MGWPGIVEYPTTWPVGSTMLVAPLVIVATALAKANMSPSRTPDTESAAAPATAVRANAASRVQSASSRTTMTGIPWSTDAACTSSVGVPRALTTTAAASALTARVSIRAKSAVRHATPVIRRIAFRITACSSSGS